MKKKMITIGIPGWSLGDNSFGVTKTYLEYASQFGNVRILMPHEGVVEEIDMLLLTGGRDISPTSIGQIPGYMTGETDIYKQHFYEKNLDNYIKSGIPILGICLGFQQLGCKFGLKLEQHLFNHPQSEDRGEEGHEVTFLEENVIEMLGTLPKKKMPVNSHHHQGFVLPQPSKEEIMKDSVIMPLAVYAEDMVLEAFAHRELPIFGIQWHPEEWYDDFSKAVFQRLVEFAASTKKHKEVTV